MYKRLELNTLEIKILRFLFRPDFFSPKFYRAQRRFFFREKKPAVELCKILAKKKPDEIKTGDFYFREYEILNAYTCFQLLFLYGPGYFLSLA